VPLPVLEDQTHHPSYLVERGIGQILFLLQSLQPLLDVTRAKSKEELRKRVERDPQLKKDLIS